jgi:uncharacterized protein involved in outer membrane biogenesis
MYRETGTVYKNLTRRQRVSLWVAGALAVSGVIASLFFSAAISTSGLKEKIEAYLSEELQGEVTIDTLEGRLFPRVSVTGGGIIVRDKGRTDVPPLLTIERFEIAGSFRALMEHPRHVSEVKLQGLRVNIPPGDDDEKDEPEREKTDAEKIAGTRKYEAIIIDRFEAPDTVLTLIPRKANKQPKVFTIHHLVMDSVGAAQTIPYIATLTNPIPKGEIEASGTFGPWNAVHPERTPVNGKYLFENANMDTIKGLSGILRSVGEFKGPLNRLLVQGTTEIPDFKIDDAGKAVSLSTRFTAVVDGSDGDTYLNQVDAKFLNSELIAKGAVVGLEDVPGREIKVDVTMPNGRIEDLLALVMESDKPLMVGPAQLQANLVIPAEKGKKVIDKLQLRGSFGLTQAKFTDASVQEKLVGFSRRGQGKTNNEPIGDVLSNLKGRFVIGDAVVSFSELTFGVPGAEVHLAGNYGLRSEEINFKGELRMQAALSEVAGGGVKGFFLKAFDPFFKEPGAGMVLPIKIAGTRKAPKYGLNMFGKDKGN